MGKVANGIVIYTCLTFKQRKNYYETWCKHHMIEDYLTYVTFISYLLYSLHGKPLIEERVLCHSQ